MQAAGRVPAMTDLGDDMFCVDVALMSHVRSALSAMWAHHRHHSHDAFTWDATTVTTWTLHKAHRR